MHEPDTARLVMNPFGFWPDPARTAAVDRAIRCALADSVGQVLDRARGVGIGWEGDLDAWRGHLLAQPSAPPLLWVCYHALVQAVVRADAEAVSAIASELMAGLPAPRAQPGRVVTVSPADLGPVDAARVIAVIDSDPALPLDLRAVPPGEVARVAGLMREARALLAEAAPALGDEIDTLGHLAVLAVGGARRFGGAASVFLWGAVILNPTLVPDRVTLVEGLAHETAHALLFGLTLGADLTTNDPDERYASPLRADPRPIEGIVHAVYVLARMSHAMTRLMRSTSLTAVERAQVADKLTRSRANYEAGLTTVDAHARFTSEGAEIFRACRTAMART